MSIGINLRVTGHTSIGGRKYQEDFFSVAYQQTENDQSLEYAFFGIYDGHGGAEASLYAREHLMNTIVSQKLFWSENDEDVLKAIRDGYIQTHYSMWREQGKIFFSVFEISDTYAKGQCSTFSFSRCVLCCQERYSTNTSAPFV